MKIDLGEKHEKCEAMPVCPSTSDDKDKIWYPSVYIGNRMGNEGVDGLEGLKADQEVALTGRVKSVTVTDRDGKKSTSCEIEVIAIETGSSKKAPKKKDDDEEVIDKGIDEASEEDEKEKA